MSIEAVNSVLNAAPSVPAGAGQTSATDYSGNTALVQKGAQGPYVSPYDSIDARTGIVVVEIRNTQTGVVTERIPYLPNPIANGGDQAEQPQNNVSLQGGIASNGPPPATTATSLQLAAFEAPSSVSNNNAGSVSLLA